MVRVFENKSILILISLFIGSIIGILFHEFGHLVIALIFDYHIEKIRITPFLEIFPEIKFVNFNSDFGEVIFEITDSQKGLGIYYLSGSGLNALISLLGVLLLRNFKLPDKWKIYLYLISLILALDIICYSIFPLFGLPHWVIIGGTSPEPFEGAKLLGISAFVYYLCLIIYSAFVYIFIVDVIRKLIKR